MKKLMLFILLSFLFVVLAHAWEFVPGNSISVCNFAESADGTRQLVGLNGGGFWLSNDAGNTWTPINDHVLPPNAASFNPDKIIKIEMLDAAGDTIMTKYICDHTVGWAYSISVDGGENWRELRPPTNTNTAALNYAAIDPMNHSRIDYAVNGLFFTSEDLGETWIEVSEYPQVQDDISGFTYNITNTDIIYGFGKGHDGHGINTSLFFSVDHGTTWIAPERATEYFNMPGLEVFKVLSLTNGETIAFPRCCFEDITLESIYLNSILRNTDVNRLWTLEEGALPENYLIEDAVEVPGYPGHILVCPKGTTPKTIVHGNIGFDSWCVGKPYLSTDYGHTFSPVISEVIGQHIMVNSISFNRFSNSVYLNTEKDGVLKSNDGGSSWERYPTVESTGIGRYEYFKVSEDALLFAGENYQMNMYDLNTENWVEVEFEGFTVDEDTSVFHSIPIVDNNGLVLITSTHAVSNNNIFNTRLLRKRSSEDNWEILEVPYGWTILPKKSNVIDAFFNQNMSRLIICDYNMLCPRFNASLDSGSTWIIPAATPFVWFGRDILQREDEIFIFEECVDIRRSTDNGNTWTNTGCPHCLQFFKDNEILLGDPNDGAVYTIRQGFWQKYDGTSWQTLSNDTYERIDYAALIPCEDSDSPPVLLRNYLSRKISISVDGGYTWERIDQEMPLRRQIACLGQIEYDSWRNRIWISTSLGMVYANVEELLSVEDHGTSFIPLDAKPISAYPNPFNAMVNISFKVEKAGPVELKLFNINGQEVATLIDEVRQAGYQELSYDASSLSSAIYFLKFNDGTNIHTQKITLVK